MRTAFNRTRTFRGDSGGMYEGSGLYDGSATGDFDQGLLARLGAQCCVESPVDLIDHVKGVAAVVTAARARQLNDRGRRRTLGQVHAPAASEGAESK